MKTCTTCEKPLGARNTSGYCSPHLNQIKNRDPAFRAKAAAGLKRSLAHDPELREKYRRNAAALSALPQTKAAKRERWMAEKPWLLSNASRPAGSDSRRKAAARQSETKLAGIPREVRQLYHELTRSKGYRAAEARQIVLDQHAADMARFRAKLAPAPAEQMDTAPLPDCPLAAVASILGIPESDMLGSDRIAPFVDARAVVSVVLRARGMSFPAIGKRLNRDHTSIMNLVQSFDRRASLKPHLRSAVERLAA